MTTQTEQKFAHTTAEHKASVLEQHGVDVWDWVEGVEPLCPFPTICFLGHDDEGMRVVNIALDNGFPVSLLQKEWVFEPLKSREPAGPRWVIVFYCYKLRRVSLSQIKHSLNHRSPCLSRTRK